MPTGQYRNGLTEHLSIAKDGELVSLISLSPSSPSISLSHSNMVIWFSDLTASLKSFKSLKSPKTLKMVNKFILI